MKVMTKKKLDSYYRRALAVAEDSPDEQTKVGALLIHGESGAVIGSGYNGFVRNAPDEKLPKTRPEKYDYMVHAEANMIFNCAKHGITTNECFVFCTLSPCCSCMRALYQSGIYLVFFKDVYRDFTKNAGMKDLHLKISEIDGGYYACRIEPRVIKSEDDS